MDQLQSFLRSPFLRVLVGEEVHADHVCTVESCNPVELGKTLQRQDSMATSLLVSESYDPAADPLGINFQLRVRHMSKQLKYCHCEFRLGSYPSSTVCLSLTVVRGSCPRVAASIERHLLNLA